MREFTFLFLLLAFTTLSSCYERLEGCLDINASNYDTSADDGCMDCCEFPRLSVTINHMIEGEALRFNDTLINDVGDSIILINQQFFLSNVSLGDNGSLLDSITFAKASGGSIRTIDDFVLVRQNIVTFPMTDFIYNGEVEQFSLTLGLEDDLNDIVLTESQATSSILASGRGMRAGDRYLTYTLSAAVGLGLRDTISIQIDEDYPIVIDLDNPVFIERGENVGLNVTFDYYELIRNIEFANQSEEVIQEQIRLNLENVIY